jgi:hypothetical protein
MSQADRAVSPKSSQDICLLNNSDTQTTIEIELTQIVAAARK